jgi:hypothetical protein
MAPRFFEERQGSAVLLVRRPAAPRRRTRPTGSLIRYGGVPAAFASGVYRWQETMSTKKPRTAIRGSAPTTSSASLTHEDGMYL